MTDALCPGALVVLTLKDQGSVYLLLEHLPREVIGVDAWKCLKVNPKLGRTDVRAVPTSWLKNRSP